MRTEVRPVTQTPRPAPLLDPHLPKTSMEWLEKLTKLCEENEITLILMKSPSISPHWYDEWDEEIKVFAQSHGLWYTNTIAENGAIGIDYSTDTCDMGQHLNVYGAEKLSHWLGARLKERADLPDRRTEAAYAAVWDEKTERYEREKAALAVSE